MKAYTDLEQSKKLAEILPPESADMYWDNSDTGGRSHTIHIGKSIAIERNFLSYKLGGQICAWSLAALLSILEYPTLEEDNIGKGKTGWIVSVYPEYPEGCRYDSDWYDNPIDACYEMILKLNEMKML